MEGKILVYLIFSTSIVFSQNGAFNTANLQQSPLLIGAGNIGAAIPNDDVLGFYFNPAILGYSARNNHVSISVMPTKTDWFTQDYYYIYRAYSSYIPLSSENEKPTFKNSGFNLGYNLNTTNLKLPITVGLGYLYNNFDYGDTYFINIFDSYIPEQNNIESYDKFNCFSLGLGIDYFIKFNVGLSFKSYESKITAPFNYEAKRFTADGTMMDYGALLIVPISELILINEKYEYDGNLKLKPITNFSLGFSSSNHGDELYYIDKSQKDPLSRTARIGYTFEFGLDLILEKSSINFFKYSFTAEAEDLLIEYKNAEMYSGTKYQNGIGDIDLRDHLFFLVADDNVVVHKGHILNFFDTLTLTFGSFSGRYYNMIQKTNGVGFSTKGLFKLLNPYLESDALKFLTEYFVIEYFDTDYIIGTRAFGQGTINFDAFSIHFVGYEF